MVINKTTQYSTGLGESVSEGLGGLLVNGSTISVDTMSEMGAIPVGSLNPGQHVAVSGSLFEWDGAAFINLGVLTMEAFGIVADGDGTVGVGTNNTSALKEMATYLNGKSGITVYGPTGWVRFIADNTTPIFDLSSCGGIKFEISGTNFKDDHTYATNEQATLWNLSGCSDIYISHGEIKSREYSPVTANATGLNVVNIGIGCNRIVHKGTISGALSGTASQRTIAGTTTADKSRGIESYLKTTSVEYPFNLRDSGDNSLAIIDAEDCGRPFFVYGVDGVDILVRTKNQGKQSYIQSYGGRKTSNINARIIDKETQTYTVTSDRFLGLATFGTGSAISNITINLDVELGTNTIGDFISLEKLDSGGTQTTADLGQSLENIEISGSFNRTYTSSVFRSFGEFHANESIKNIRIKDISLLSRDTGGNLILTIFNNVSSPDAIRIENVSDFKTCFLEAPATFVNCSGDTFCDNNAVQTYIGSVINLDSLQNTENKVFINTDLAGELKNTLGNNIYVSKESKLLSGDLSAQQNIFKFPASAAGRFRLKYYLVRDISDLNPGTRDETEGIKSFSVTTNSSGIFSTMLTVADEVTERVLGTGTALNITLVNGDSSGGFIAVDAPTYTSANSRAVFELEAMSYYDYAKVTPV